MLQGNVLRVRRLVLDRRPEAAKLPPNRLDPIDPARVDAFISDAESDYGDLPSISQGLRRLSNAFAEAVNHDNLALQMTAVLGHLELPYMNGDMAMRTTSNLVSPSFVYRLLKDPLGCVRSYNLAVAADPEAGIRPLYLGRDVVEVPLWAQDKTTVTPVYADLGDSKRPQLFTTAHNNHLDLTGSEKMGYLRPRALTLSAIMRSEHCDLFIHGTGGGVYDQVTERWWQDWIGEDLAPKAVVSADVYLPFDVPTATAEEHARARWYAHHLPHNVDRYIKEHAEADAVLSAEKHQLLDRMNIDRDKRRRAKAFKRIHAINAELRRRHDVLIQSAQRRAEDARAGLANAAVARRRDWCFALYPDDQIRVLKQHITASLLSD